MLDKNEILPSCLAEDVDLLVPHQANIRIIDAAVKRLRISPDRVVVNLERYGNMSAASIPVALDEAGIEYPIFQGGMAWVKLSFT